MTNGHVLRQLRENGQFFNDPDFPPDESSIWRNPAEKSSSENFHSLSHAVKWCRIKDIFRSDSYVKVRFPTTMRRPRLAGSPLSKRVTLMRNRKRLVSVKMEASS